MKRVFERHRKRWTKNLDGFWSFFFLEAADPLAFSPLDAAKAAFSSMPVPGCFDALPEYAGRRGCGVYTKKIDLNEPGRYRLHLHGLHHFSRIWVNGAELGSHAGGYTSFYFDFSADAGETEIMILTDNGIDYERNPLHLDYFDWYHYGGISRGAELQKLPETWIEAVTIQTLDSEKRLMKAVLDICSVCDAQLPLRMYAGKKEMVSQILEVSAKGLRREFEFSLPGHPLWTPENPHLEMLEVSLGADDYRQRFGIRTVECRGRQLLLNGEPVHLFGFNRHESHPQFGAALPAEVMMTDLQLMKDLGCNFVRGSHYPQDPRFLDLCDEAGILVWSEAIGWQHSEEHLTDPHFLSRQKQHIAEMIGGAVNHPSVIMWGLLNESADGSEKARKGYRELISRIRECDDSRPVTFATANQFKNINMDLVDIVSFNCYPGWYFDEIEGIPAYIDSILADIERKGFGEKPVILSEIGAGALYGFRDRNRARWSEEYQSALLKQTVEYWKQNKERLCGLALWQFCDCRASAQTQRILGRPRGFNNKGIIDEWRRPKSAYDTVKKLMNPKNN